MVKSAQFYRFTKTLATKSHHKSQVGKKTIYKNNDRIKAQGTEGGGKEEILREEHVFFMGRTYVIFYPFESNSVEFYIASPRSFAHTKKQIIKNKFEYLPAKTRTKCE